MSSWRVAREAEPEYRGDDIKREREEEEVTKPAPLFGCPIGEPADEEGERCLDQGDGDIKDKFVQSTVVAEGIVVLVTVLPLSSSGTGQLMPLIYTGNQVGRET